VVIEPNRGAFVASFTADQLVELFDLRVMLEVDALRRAIPHHTERTLRRLDSLQVELVHTDDPVEWIRCDRAFHEELYAPSARGRTLELIAGLRASVERSYLAFLGPNARREGWNTEHRQLMDAVQGRRPRVAGDVLESHLRHTQALVIASVNTPE
jgi:DNA-binding GntR family transcriptional regulator